MGLLGAVWGSLEPSFGALGGHLEASWGPLGTLLAVSGPSLRTTTLLELRVSARGARMGEKDYPERRCSRRMGGQGSFATQLRSDAYPETGHGQIMVLTLEAEGSGGDRSITDHEYM